MVVADIVVLVVLIVSDSDRWLQTPLLSSLGLRPPSLLHGVCIALRARIVLWLAIHRLPDPLTGRQLVGAHAFLHGLRRLRKKKLLHGDLHRRARNLLRRILVHRLMYVVVLVHVSILVPPMCRWTLRLVHFVFHFFAFLPLLTQVDEFSILASSKTLTTERRPLIFHRILKRRCIQLLQVEIEGHLRSQSNLISSIMRIHLHFILHTRFRCLSQVLLQLLFL